MLRTLLAVCAVVCFGGLPAQSDEYTFKVQSLHPNAVQIKFYSQTRKGHQWPDVKTAWDLDNDKVHELGMICNDGEKICWGAWVKGGNRPEWGAGAGGTDACPDCCFSCRNGQTQGVWVLNAHINGDRVTPTATLVRQEPRSTPPIRRQSKGQLLDNNP
jgi:hypothetical protein